ncbi:Na/Pi symporter [Lentisphaerota bacterium WC36G]
MTEIKREILENRLKEVKQRLEETEKRLENYCSAEEMKDMVNKLSAERAKAEEEMMDLLVELEEPFRVEAWQGFKNGLLTTIKQAEKSLKNSIEKHRKVESAKPIVGPILEKITSNKFVAWFSIVLLVYLLLLSVGGLSAGFKWISGGKEQAEQLFKFATNPFMGLIIGMLATALVQSSSTTTSIIVTLCAGGLPISAAVPMVLGANIGTTVTNSLVSLGHIGNAREFKRAFAAATVHDFFNLLAVLIFLPLEIIFHPLEKVSGYLSQTLIGSSSFNVKDFNFVKTVTKPVIGGAKSLFKMIPGENWIGASLFIIVAVILVFTAILLLGKLLRTMMVGKAEEIFHKAVGRSSTTGIGAGALITVLVQSSSTTTSLIVPLAGSGIMSLKQIYPFTLGANIGTCVTSLLAAMAITGSGAVEALQVALVHLLYNSLAVVVIYGVVFLRTIPLWCATSLARIASERKSLAFLYIVGIFFVMPAICLGTYNKLYSNKTQKELSTDVLQLETQVAGTSKQKTTAINSVVCPKCSTKVKIHN